MDEQKFPTGDQTTKMAEMELAELRAENAALRQALDELRYDADVEACHAAGLTAQIKALIAESDACPHKEAHPLVQRVEYTHSRTGQKITKTGAFPLYREAFDAEAKVCGIEDPEQIRS
ncbi:MAG TPA: hypothetical protein VK558_19000 [Patescibacteria group bacterium]|nr:hypothetical protein [Patescibacteria group bacterium]